VLFLMIVRQRFTTERTAKIHPTASATHSESKSRSSSATASSVGVIDKAVDSGG
jgi:hypothetical protein